MNCVCPACEGAVGGWMWVDVKPTFVVVAMAILKIPAQRLYSVAFSLKILTAEWILGQVQSFWSMVSGFYECISGKPSPNIKYISLLLALGPGPRHCLDEQHTLHLDKAVYGIKTSSLHCHQRVASKPGSIGAAQRQSEADIWMSQKRMLYGYIIVKIAICLVLAETQ